MISEIKNNETKICKKCGRELPIDKFGINHNYTRICQYYKTEL